MDIENIYAKDEIIIYTPKISTYDKFKVYKINRFWDSKVALRKAANYMLDNISDDGTKIVYDNSEYENWVKEAFKDIYLFTTPEVPNNRYVGNPWAFSNAQSHYYAIPDIDYKTFIERNLQKAYSNLFLTKPTEQKRYMVQYLQSDDYNIKMIACDMLRHSDCIYVRNPKLLELIITGKFDLIEDVML